MTPGAAFTLSCPKCGGTLPGALCNLTEPTPCPACNATILAEVFPAIFQTPAAGQTAEPLLEEGAASCFYHEHKKAVTHCDACGRFLCALCDVDFGGQHLCPTCLQTGKKKGKLAALDTTRTLWDSAALLMGVLAIIPTIGFVTGPLAIVFAVVSFFKPGSLVPRTRLRAVLAIVISLAGMLFWAWVFYLRDYLSEL